MMQWVENGTAPEQLIATKWNNDTLEDGILMQRTLCPYPQKAVYDGSGDWHAASSWSCQGGELLSFPAQNGSIGTVKAVQLNATGVCVDNCTSSSNEGNGSSSNSGHKSGAKALRVLGEDALKLAGWGFLALLGIGHML
jgi:Tannase and feruloyl esterase